MRRTRVRWAAGTVLTLVIGSGALGCNSSKGIDGSTKRHGDASVEASSDGSASDAVGPDRTACTACGNVCGLTTVAPLVSSFTVDDAYVYWTDNGDPTVTGDGRILRAPSSGCGSTVLVGGLAENADNITIDGGNLYWTTDEVATAVMRAPLAGGIAVTLATGLPSYPGRLSIGIAHMVLTIEPSSSGILPAAYSLPVAGGAATQVPGVGSGYELASDQLVWVSGGELKTMSLTSGNVVSLSGPVGSLGDYAVYTDNAYWLEFSFTDGGVASAALKSAPIAGGGVTTVAAGIPGLAGDLLVRADGIYLVTASPGQPAALLRFPLSGGTPTTIASVPDIWTSIIYDGANAYWTESITADSGATWRMLRAPLSGGNAAVIGTGNAGFTTALKLTGTSAFWIWGTDLVKLSLAGDCSDGGCR